LDVSLYKAKNATRLTRYELAEPAQPLTSATSLLMSSAHRLTWAANSDPNQSSWPCRSRHRWRHPRYYWRQQLT